MKKLLILLISLISALCGMSQNQIIDAQQVLVRSYFRIPVWDTVAAARFDKEWRIRPQDGITYQYDATSLTFPKWKPLFGNPSGGLQTLSNVGSGLPIFKSLNGTTAELRTIVPLWGIIGQTNTNDVSLRIDTTSNGVPTYWRLTYSIDSLVTLIQARVKYTDTASMLANYFRKPTGNTSQYIRGDGTLATFPTIPPNTSITSLSPEITVTPTGVNSFNLSFSGGGGPGSVTSVSSGSLASFFTSSVSNPTTTPSISYSLSNAPAYQIWGNNSTISAIPTYFTPVLASALFRNQGTTTDMLIGNAAGNPSWGKVNLSNMIIGNLPVTNLNGGIGAGSNTFWRGDGVWAIPPSSGGGGSGSGGNITDNFY